MKKTLIAYLVLILLIVFQIHIISCVNKKKYDDTHTSGDRTIYVEEFRGHSVWVADQKLTNDPECPKCRENLRQLITEVVDSIVDDRVVKLLGK